MQTFFRVATVFFLLVISQSALAAPPIRPPDPVEVVNFPNSQEVTGTVAVSNLPAVQDVNVVTPACPPRPASAIFQLVGFTSQRLVGTAGVLAFTLACQSAFPGSRMCSSEEIVQTVTVPSGLSGGAWVRPTFQPIATQDDRGYAIAADISGLAAFPTSLTCTGWSLPFYHGLSVTAAGQFSTSLCEESRAVACCAPVP